MYPPSGGSRIGCMEGDETEEEAVVDEFGVSMLSCWFESTEELNTFWIEGSWVERYVFGGVLMPLCDCCCCCCCEKSWGVM